MISTGVKKVKETGLGNQLVRLKFNVQILILKLRFSQQDPILFLELRL
jgi:hypothetical protein